MRNLKKALSLCLAFVMLLGLMMIGAGAINSEMYSDTNQIAENRQEAVDLLNALGIMTGADGGAFGPNENLQRDQAAKIVAWANLGKDANDSVAIPATAPFSDIGPGSEWALPYIVYCKNLGIINGISLPDANGAVEYAPTAPVSGYQLAKMLLCVVGYGVNGEYTGGNWNMKVAVDAQVTGLTKGIETINNDPISRQDAAQMVFNALTMEMVAYSDLYGTYSSEYHTSLNPTLLGTKAEQVFGVRTYESTETDGTDYHYWRKVGTTTPITDSYDCDVIIEDNIYSSSAKALADKYDFAQGVEIWENGVQVKSPVYYLGEVKMERIAFLDNTVLYAPNFRNNNSNVVVYNGQKITLVDEGAKCRYDTVYEIGQRSTWGFGSNINWASGWGASSQTQLISNHTIPGGSNGAVDKIIVTTNYLAKVEGGNKATVYAPTKDQKTFSVDLGADHGYTVGDYILVVPNVTLSDLVNKNGQGVGPDTLDSNDKVLINTNLVKTAKTTAISAATVTAYAVNAANNKNNGSVTTGGQTYKYNGVFANYIANASTATTSIDNPTDAQLKAFTKVSVAEGDPDKTRAALGEKYTRATGDEYYVGRGSYTFYLDSDNNVIGVVEDNAGIRDFAYIIEVGHDDFFYYNKVRAVLSDGTVGDYYVDRSSDGYDSVGTANHNGLAGTGGDNSVLGNMSVPNGIRPGYVYAYSLNGNTIVLTDVDVHNNSATDSNATYDAVKDIYNISNAVDNRATQVYANVTGANAFNRGASAFRYTVVSKASAPATLNTQQGVSPNTNAAWTVGNHVAYASENTVFVFVYGGNNDQMTVQRYVGMSKAPTIPSDGNARKYSVSMIIRNDGNVDRIEYVVVRSSSIPTSVITENHFTVVGANNGRYTEDVNHRTLYIYDVILNGAKHTIAAYNANLAVGDVFTYDYTRNLFNGTTTSDNVQVDVGAYTATRVNGEDQGVLYNQFVDVINNETNIAVGDNNQTGADRDTAVKNIDISGAAIWSVSGRAMSRSDIKPTDTVTVICNDIGSAGNDNRNYIATEVFVISSRDEIAYNTGKWLSDTLKDGEYGFSGKKYLDLRSPSVTARTLNGTDGNTRISGDLYIDGDVTIGNGADYGNIIVEGKLTVAGTLSQQVAKLTLKDGATLEVKTVATGVGNDTAAPGAVPGDYITLDPAARTATVILGKRTFTWNGNGWTTNISAYTDINGAPRTNFNYDNKFKAGDVITVQGGAKLYVDGAITNMPTITLQNNADLEITGVTTTTVVAGILSRSSDAKNPPLIDVVAEVNDDVTTMSMANLASGSTLTLESGTPTINVTDGQIDVSVSGGSHYVYVKGSLAIKDAAGAADTNKATAVVAIVRGTVAVNAPVNAKELTVRGGTTLDVNSTVTVQNKLVVEQNGIVEVAAPANAAAGTVAAVAVTDANAKLDVTGTVNVASTTGKVVVGSTNTATATAGAVTIASATADVDVNAGAVVGADVKLAADNATITVNGKVDGEVALANNTITGAEIAGSGTVGSIASGVDQAEGSNITEGGSGTTNPPAPTTYSVSLASAVKNVAIESIKVGTTTVTAIPANTALNTITITLKAATGYTLGTSDSPAVTMGTDNTAVSSTYANSVITINATGNITGSLTIAGVTATANQSGGDTEVTPTIAIKAQTDLDAFKVTLDDTVDPNKLTFAADATQTVDELKKCFTVTNGTITSVKKDAETTEATGDLDAANYTLTVTGTGTTPKTATITVAVAIETMFKLTADSFTIANLNNTSSDADAVEVTADSVGLKVEVTAFDATAKTATVKISTEKIVPDHDNAEADPATGKWVGFTVIAPSTATGAKVAFNVAADIGSTLQEESLNSVSQGGVSVNKGVSFYVNAIASPPKDTAKIQFVDGKGEITDIYTITIDISGVKTA